MNNILLEKINQVFYKRFGYDPMLVNRSPGRINLLGEHTDYNDGFVLPAAIDKSIFFAIGKNDLNLFRFYSFDLNEYFEIQPDNLEISDTGWANYLIGVIAQIQKQGRKVTGIDCVFGGDIPVGAGLSSSAALECGFGFGLNELFEFNFSKLEIVKMGQKAEHEYVGVMCGIMDQFANTFGKDNHAIRLDCRTLEFNYYPLDLSQYTIILFDTQVKHSLASSEYNVRRKECENGVKILQKYNKSVKALRDVDMELLLKYQDEFDPVTFKRCKYVINENQRVIDACAFLEEGNMEEFGKLMFASHEGLKNEYEVSCKELDLLVEIARESSDVLGCRMMGGGFGGCTINLVREDRTEEFVKMIVKKYSEKMDKEPLVYFVEVSDGTGYIN